MTDEEKPKWIKANKVAFMEYFGYDADKLRAKLSKKIDSKEKLRKAGLED